MLRFAELTHRCKAISAILSGLVLSVGLSAIAWAADPAPQDSSSLQAQPAQRRLLVDVQAPTLRQSPNPAVQQELRRLEGMLAQAGRIKVIVGVRVAFAPEGALLAPARSAQRSEIATVQAAVVKTLPASSKASVHNYESLPFMAIEVDGEGLQILTTSSEIISIEEDKLAQPTLDLSVPLINADDVWYSGYEGTNWAVAVLDTGVQSSHPFLGGKVVSEACYSSANSAQMVSSLCPGGLTSSTTAGSGVDCDTSISGCGHGTHVAGISSGSSGVARRGQLIAIQVFSRFNSTQYCGASTPCVLTYTSDYIKGLERVFSLRSIYNIAAVNMSLGGGQYTSECDISESATKAAIDNLRSAGVATIIASGNNRYTNSISAPACISSAISVGSTWAGTGSFCASNDGVNDTVACYSNSASFLDLLAPGSNINSSVPTNTYGNKHGTSMAAPHVAGCWALLKSAVPAASVATIENALKITGKPITDTRNNITKPRIDCKAALDYLQVGQNPSLTVIKSGNGTGTVASSPAGINCGSDCAEAYTNGTSVTLTATPAAGSVFTGWSGACTGTSTCTVSMTSARSVTAAFALQTFSLSISSQGTGSGSVRVSPTDIVCQAPGACVWNYPANTTLTLTPTAASDSTFAGWGGACAGSGNTCSLNMNSAKSVSVAFNTAATGGGVSTTAFSADNQSLPISATQSFNFQLPSGARNLIVTTSGGTGDIDLRVRAGAIPDAVTYDCISYTYTNEEVCVFPNPVSGTYYALLDAYSSSAGFSIRATYETPLSLTISKEGSGNGSVVSTSVVTSFFANYGTDSSKIVGGFNVKAGAWPWQVALTISTPQGSFMCGGSLIAADWVMTAAHCVTDDFGRPYSASALQVRAGSLNFSSGGEERIASQLIVHHAYNSATFDSDVALIRVANPFTLSANVSPISAVTLNQEPTLAPNGRMATVTGWGTTSSGGPTSPTLRQVSLPIVSTQQCQATPYGSKISQNMICAGYVTGGKDSCQGDSGGPLVVSDGNGGYRLAGVVSWGNGCADSEYPGVYTRVSQFATWVQLQTGLALDGPQVECGLSCISTTAMLGKNAQIALTATPTLGSTFVGWGGACSGTSTTCTVNMTQAQNVTATFSGTPVSGQYTTQVTTMYTGYFGRPPATAGLNYYEQWMASTGGNHNVLVDDFFNSQESKQMFAGMSTRDQVIQVFNNLFARAPAQAGLDYWVNMVDTGQVSIAAMSYTVAYNAAQADLEVLNAKRKASLAFAQALNTPERRSAYSAALGLGRSYLQCVNGDSAASAAVARLEITMTNLVAGNTFYSCP